MGEVVNVLVAFAVIVFLFRWVTSGSESSEGQSASDALGFRPKNVTQDMVDRISQMFPDIPVDNIRYDLLRTGNVELTTNKILERGILEAPPQAYYALYPREPAAPAAHPNAGPSAAGTSTSLPRKPKESLISRYKLEERVKKDETIAEEQVGGKAAWEDSTEKREASLKERKAQMILAARQRFLAQQEREAAAKKAQDGSEKTS